MGYMAIQSLWETHFHLLPLYYNYLAILWFSNSNFKIVIYYCCGIYIGKLKTRTRIPLYFQGNEWITEWMSGYSMSS